MERLWAPWRLSYVASGKPPTAGDACFICEGLADSDDRARLIARRATHSVVVLNRFPYNNGHLLIAPKSHKADLRDLTNDESLELQQLLCELIEVLDKAIHPDGYNIGLNLGRVAGAGLPGHLHWHLVPRWNGDTNFMPVVTDHRVIVQSLDSFYDLLAANWKNKG